jgi:hypothetical protein
MLGFDAAMRYIKQMKQNVYTQVFCPGCSKDLVSRVAVDGTTVRDRTYTGESYIKYRCGACTTYSTWDFDNYPVPVLVKAIQYRVWNTQKNDEGLSVVVVKSGANKE